MSTLNRNARATYIKEKYSELWAILSLILHPWDSKSFLNVLFSDCVFNQSFNIYSKSDLAVSSVVSYPERSRDGQYAIYVSPSLKR